MNAKTLSLTLTLLVSNAAFASDLTLEPCIDGGVSATGTFPSQAMEDQIHAYLKWSSGQPYYLYTVASGSIEMPFSEEATLVELE